MSGVDEVPPRFALCQEIEACEYLARAPGGEAYELAPTLANVARALGALFGASDLRTLADVGAFARGQCGVDLLVQEARELRRPLMSEEAKAHEVARVQVRGAPHLLELALEPTHRIATVTRPARFIGGDGAREGLPGIGRMFVTNKFR